MYLVRQNCKFRFCTSPTPSCIKHIIAIMWKVYRKGMKRQRAQKNRMNTATKQSRTERLES